MVKVDLDNLSLEENKRLNEISLDIREEYDALVKEASHEYVQNINWVVGSVASRNKYQSPLFYRCVQLAFINDLLENSHKELMIFSRDQQLCKLLKKTLDAKHQVVCTLGKIGAIWSFFRPHRQYLIALYFFTLRILGKRKSNFKTEEPIILVDTFVLNNKSGDDGSIVNGQYKDRYYPGLLDHVDEKTKDRIFYLPTIIGFKNPISIFKKIRSANFQFLLHDDFLKVKDYLFVLKHPFKICNLDIPEVKFQGFPMSKLMKHETKMSSSDFISLLGVLYYRFTKRLSEHNIKVDLVIEWYENQVLDRGMIKGFHEFYKNTPVYGYQGYIISKDLHLYTQPSETEYQGSLVPDKVLVTGKGLMENIQEFCKKVKVDVAPGFRFSKVWREVKYTPKSDSFSILVGLPIGLNDSKHILEMLLKIKNMFDLSTLDFFIKPHPTWTEMKIKSMFQAGQLDDFTFVLGDFHDNVEKANLVISNASSVSLEALAKGIPVIIVAPETGVVQNPIPPEVSHEIWKTIYSPEELKEAIDHFNNADLITNLRSEFLKVKNDYFEPLTESGVKKFLNLR